MKIKQQKQIKSFLIEEFGMDKGKVLFNKQEIILNELIENTINKSKNQMKTLVQTIFPRIALYKVMSKDGFSKEDVYHFTAIYFLKLCA